MKKISTPQQSSETMTLPETQPRGPRKSTLSFLRQFARVYTPAPIGGVIVN